MFKDALVHAGLLTVALIYGANYSIAKFVMPEYVPAFGLIVIRVACAALFFVLLSPFMKQQPIARADWPRLIACAFFGVAFNQLLFFKGLSLTSPIHASVLMLVTPILVLLGAAFALKEKVSSRRWLGIALGVSGAALLVVSAAKADKSASVIGDVCVFLNAASYAVFLILAKPLLYRYSALTLTKYTFVLGLPMVLPFGLPELTHVNWAEMPVSVYAGIGFIVLFVTIVAYLLNAWTMQYVSPGTVGAYIYLQPVFAVGISLLLGIDTITLQKALYIGLIFVGVYLAQRR